MTTLIVLTNTNNNASISFHAEEVEPGQFTPPSDLFDSCVRQIFPDGYRDGFLRAYVPTWQRELGIGTTADGRYILTL